VKGKTLVGAMQIDRLQTVGGFFAEWSWLIT